MSPYSTGMRLGADTDRAYWLWFFAKALLKRLVGLLVAPFADYGEYKR